MMEGEKELKNESDDFTKKREMHTLAIRKKDREQIFAKKRNLPQSGSKMSSDQKPDNYIVDQRFYEYVEKFHKNRYHLETLPQLVKAIYDPDIIQQHYGLIGVRKIMSIADDPPIQPIVDTGIIPKLIEYINQDQYPQLQLEATWALTNVASGTPQQCQSIVDKGAIPLFIKLLKSSTMGIVQQAVWAIGNIASDSSFHRDTIIRNGGLQNMIYAIKNINDPCLIQHSGWALSNMCRGQPLPNYELIKDAIPILADLIARGLIKDKSIMADCCWAISYNTSSDRERIQILINADLPHILVRNLREDYYSLLVPTIRIVGHITMGDHNQTQTVVKEPDLFDNLYALLLHEKRIVRAETCWIISNIAAGNTEQVDQLISRDDIFGQLLKLFQTDANDVRRQISHIFSNLTIQGNPQRIFNFFKSINIIRFYLINLTNTDYRLLRDCLVNLFSILKLGDSFRVSPTNGGNPANLFIVEMMNNGGTTILEQLQMHEQKSVYENVLSIVKEFFEIDDNMDI